MTALGKHGPAKRRDTRELIIDEAERLIGEGGPQVFVHPKSTHGLLVQLSKKG